jgi:hypothetical protein
VQGDELIATSGITYTTEQQYGETRVKGGEQVIRLLCRGEVRGPLLNENLKIALLACL